MKIKVIKDHHGYALGEHEVDEQRGDYLIRMSVAEEATEENDNEGGQSEDYGEAKHAETEEVGATEAKPSEKVKHKPGRKKKEKVEGIKHTGKKEH